MNLTCHLCQKQFKSKRALEYHVNEAKFPCNLQCVVCDEVCSSVGGYKKHIITHNAVPEIEKNDDSTLLLLKIENLQLKLQLQEQKTEKDIKERDNKIRSLKRKDKHKSKAVLVLEDYPIPVNDIIITNLELQNMIPMNMIFRAMRTLSSETEELKRYKLTTITVKLMHEVYQNKNFKFHNMLLCDLSRKTISVFTKVNNHCQWVRYTREMGLQVLNQCAKSFFTVLFEKALQLMQTGLWTFNEMVTRYCLFVSHDCGIFIFYKMGICLCGEMVPKSEVSAQPENDDHNEVKRLLEIRRGEISIMLDKHHVPNYHFEYMLEKTRQNVYPTYERTKNVC